MNNSLWDVVTYLFLSTRWLWKNILCFCKCCLMTYFKGFRMFRWKYSIFTMHTRQASGIVLLLHVLPVISSKIWLHWRSWLELFSWWTSKKWRNSTWFPLPLSFLLHSPSACFKMGQQFYFVFPWKLFCVLKWVITEFKIVMIKSRVTGIAIPLSHKNFMRISTSDSLSTNLERGLALSKIPFTHRHTIIIPLTSDIVPTLSLFYYGKYRRRKKNPEQAVAVCWT